MLKEFSVSNFQSIKDKLTFSMETGAYLKKYSSTNVNKISGNSLLKSAVVFGANGSGKTNLILAISTMKRMIVREAKTVTSPLPFRPYSFIDIKDKDTNFEINFLFKKIEYVYNFSYNQKEIVKESLRYVSQLKDIELFYRDKYNDVFRMDASLNINVSSIRDNQLILYVLQSTNEEHSSNVYRWFNDNLIIDDFSDDTDIANSALINNVLLGDNKLRLLEYLKYADSNIIDVEVVREKRNFVNEFNKMANMIALLNDSSFSTKIEFNDNISRDIFTLHTVYHKFDSDGNIVGTEKLSMGSESSGTKKLITIALVLLDIGNENKTLIIDELDRSLHYNIITALIKLFNSKQNQNQLIFTTHNLMLIDECLRTDQIYFVEKDYKGVSNLYSLFDFNESQQLPRGDIKYLKRYKDGLFGAIPNVDAQRMIRILRNEEVA